MKPNTNRGWIMVEKVIMCEQSSPTIRGGPTEKTNLVTIAEASALLELLRPIIIIFRYVNHHKVSTQCPLDS